MKSDYTVKIKITELEVPYLTNEGNGDSRLDRSNLIFDTNIQGISQVKSENGKNDRELVKTIKFTVHEDVESGIL